MQGDQVDGRVTTGAQPLILRIGGLFAIWFSTTLFPLLGLLFTLAYAAVLFRNQPRWQVLGVVVFLATTAAWFLVDNYRLTN